MRKQKVLCLRFVSSKWQDMKAALADIWGMKEGKNPFKKEEEEEKPVITKGGKTLTGKKPAEIDVNLK